MPFINATFNICIDFEIKNGELIDFGLVSGFTYSFFFDGLQRTVC